ncbi:ankyrin repeat protein [Bacteriovorax sp. BAL6_X]|uniref:ankyrin repeat domain-containing protein n=1 Tax=Bacteriovorax sp. BAL6_X TaxID=1201290 RepID=UPI000385F9C7|nr:ankyrin repeat domain-containing protein [Bacteriovorax sp. BAL6_X]EPZ50850.1 ankyrin repeat protein [Bacteriovorax sp. BAL6_X]
MNKSVIPIIIFLIGLATYISNESTKSVQEKYQEPTPINAIESPVAQKQAALQKKPEKAISKNEQANHNLLGALADEREDLIIQALNNGANPNLIFNNRHFTMAMDKSLNCNPNVLKALIKAGAYLELKDTHGKSAMDYAKRNGSPECIKILSDAGVN